MCAVEGDEVGEGRLESCEDVATFAQAVEGTREHSVVTGGGPSGVISETAGAGQLYVALTRYLKAGEATAADVLAVILKAVITYDHGEISFLVRCSYAGDGRVVLTAVGSNHRRIRLGSARFYCSGERDDPAVHVEVTARGRRLLERAQRIQIRALVVDPERERQPKGARQSFVLNP